MTRSVCIIDDQIPAILEKTMDDKRMLNSSNLKLLLLVDWSEPELKNLVANLLGSDRTLSAFTHPAFFINHLDDSKLIRPDIIIFDWDTGSGNSKEQLLEILKATFCVVAIYTRVDKKTAIETEVIDHSSFKDFKNRLVLFFKDEPESQTKLLTQVEEIYNNNFSFQIGGELRTRALKAVDSLLVELGKNTPEAIVWFLGEDDKTRNVRHLLAKDLIAMLVEKLRDNLITSEFGTVLPEIPMGKKIPGDDAIVRRLWRYRMFYMPRDDVVRKGDIIRKQGSDGSTLFLVLSSDCHLNMFWKKNMGFFTLVPMDRIDSKNETLKAKLGFANIKKEALSCTSITNTNPFQGPTIIPGIPVSGHESSDYLLCPKEIFAVKVDFPMNVDVKNKTVARLLYAHIPDYEGQHRVSISEPFLTPLVEHLTSNISGYGAPDYPEELKRIINDNMKKMLG